MRRDIFIKLSPDTQESWIIIAFLDPVLYSRYLDSFDPSDKVHYSRVISCKE